MKKYPEYEPANGSSVLDWKKIFRLMYTLLNRITDVSLVKNKDGKSTRVRITVSNTFKHPKDRNYIDYAAEEVQLAAEAVQLRVCEKFWNDFTATNIKFLFAKDGNLKIVGDVDKVVNAKLFMED